MVVVNLFSRLARPNGAVPPVSRGTKQYATVHRGYLDVGTGDPDCARAVGPGGSTGWMFAALAPGLAVSSVENTSAEQLALIQLIAR